MCERRPSPQSACTVCRVSGETTGEGTSMNVTPKASSKRAIFSSNSSTQTNKNALHPSFAEGRRAHFMALMVPPSFVDASRHQPCRVLTYSCPLTGATGKGLLSHVRFLLAAPGFIHTVLTYGL